MTELERLKTIRNGTKAASTFTDAEMERRLTNLREYMERTRVEAVLFTSYHNVSYYSGFLYTSFGRNYALVVTHDSSTTISANIDAGQPWRRTYGDNVVYTDWRQDNFLHAVSTVLQRVGVRSGKLGVEDDQINGTLRAQIADVAQGMTLIDISRAVMYQRMIKSPEEIDLIKQGARIADLGGVAAVQAISEDVPEYEVALAGTKAMTREIAKTFPSTELRDTWVWFQSGLNTDGAHNWPTTRRVQKGDILSLNCFPMIAGYYTALERTLIFGQPTPTQLRYWQINIEVHLRGIELIRPGAVCKEIAAELNEIYESYGLVAKRTFGYGHSFGVLSHYYGREAGLELREDVATVIEPGMVVSMEPMLMIPEGEPGSGGYREHDILVVGHGGSENITSYPIGPENNVLGA